MLETNVKLVNIIYHVSCFMFNVQYSEIFKDIDKTFKTFKLFKDIIIIIFIMKDIIMQVYINCLLRFVTFMGENLQFLFKCAIQVQQYANMCRYPTDNTFRPPCGTRIQLCHCQQSRSIAAPELPEINSWQLNIHYLCQFTLHKIKS